MIELRLLEIVRIELETPSTKSIYLKPIDGKPLHFIAGQFLSLVFESGEHAFRRSYSISSLPGDEWIRITVKRISNGNASRQIFDHWQIGQHVQTLEPYGRFVLPEITQAQDFFFIAAGSGITPIISLIREALLRFPHVKIHLLYSNRSRSECIFLNELQKLQEYQPQRLQIHWFFSDAQAISQARLQSDWLNNYLKKTSQSESHVFTCGPESFMYLAEVVSLSEGIPIQHFHQELFYQEEEPEIRNWGTSQYGVSLTYKNKRYDWQIPANQTILSFAKEQQVELPWSCEAGRCSTCMATCISGTVEMTRNEVLTDSDLAAGKVLLCTAHPQSDHIVLKVPSYTN
ncbi:MAG TPA: iron-sulfur cluster-binding domain-containing protein [Flavobacteriales bacterium]|nr:iron-sulfur cluster-binding domain-containing protein [Flavobacteriales bacterium]